jgi:hypothetical protein
MKPRAFASSGKPQRNHNGCCCRHSRDYLRSVNPKIVGHNLSFFVAIVQRPEGAIEIGLDYSKVRRQFSWLSPSTDVSLKAMINESLRTTVLLKPA